MENHKTEPLDGMERPRIYADTSIRYTETNYFMDRLDEIQILYDRLMYEVTQMGFDVLDTVTPESFASFVVNNSTIRPLGRWTRRANGDTFRGPQVFTTASD